MRHNESVFVVSYVDYEGEDGSTTVRCDVFGSLDGALESMHRLMENIMDDSMGAYSLYEEQDEKGNIVYYALLKGEEDHYVTDYECFVCKKIIQ